jgi:phospholipid/cholesterol/gamma-HCH transport system permease protein
VQTPSESAPRARWADGVEGAVLELSGDWLRDGPQPQIDLERFDGLPDRYLTESLGRFDSTLPAFLLALLRGDDRRGGATAGPAPAPELDGLPPELCGLMELALAVPEESEASTTEDRMSELKRLGSISIRAWQAVVSVANFTGQVLFSFGRLLSGRAHIRSGDFWRIVQDCGAGALPIVSLISFLIGLILAFVGNVQLANFGASLYVADLVAIAMLREMGVMMTAIIISGRTGAAFAAHLGSMKANQEIDALKTFGFDPFDFLVLPRMLALILMMPILTIYSNIIGILGGMVVGAAVNIPPVLYWNETLEAVDLTTASLGVFKSVFFGAAIAMSGCMQGMKAASSSAGVGIATTRAVVASITVVIVLDSAFAAVFTILDI